MKRITQTKAIRLKCLDCSDGQADVKNCYFADCELYPGRMGKRPKGFRPLKAIRKYCLWCTNNLAAEVKSCLSVECLIYPFRMGKGTTGRKS